MKILLMSYNDIQGGANIASFRLFKALNKYKLNTKLYCCNKKSKNNKVITSENLSFKIFKLVKAKVHNTINRFYKYFSSKENLNPMISLNIFPSNWSNRINRDNYDLVNFHWIGNETISLSDIGRIKKKIVFTLHDCWAFQSVEHYPTKNINKYLINKKNNNLNLIQNIIFQKKLEAFRNVKHVIAPSNWIANLARRSKIFKNSKIEVIPNPLNTKIYKPLNKKECKKFFNFKKKIILFGSAAPLDNPAKNFKCVINIVNNLKKLHKFKNCQLVIYGAYDKQILNKIKFNYKHVGFINNEKKLAKLYNAADVFLQPSKIDNLPQTAIESIACGTPVVSFNIGGMKDIVDTNKNGYLVKPFNEKEYLNKVIKLLNSNTEKKKKIKKYCYSKALKLWSSKVVGLKYKDFYEKVINEN